MNNIELKSINELLGKRFFVPSYQRGYRWTNQQVKDLLDDVNEFIQNGNSNFYSLQPLVIKKRWPTNALDEVKKLPSVEEVERYINRCEWEVIDGQQRLTTIFIILFYIEKREPYAIKYETRIDLDVLGFLETIEKRIVNNNKTTNELKTFIELVKETKEEYNNIDFYHIFTSYSTIKKWFEDNKQIDEGYFEEQLLKKVNFIWYESVNEDPIKVFTRLNIGKIKLTNSELIKALMLNRSNFHEESSRHIKLRQQEISSEWDEIEYNLQNDEFWMFLQEKDYKKTTRIDFIFDLICDRNPFNIDKVTIGTDEYKTFRYFYEYFHKMDNDTGNKLKVCWDEVRRYYQTFQEWFNDLVLYHYIGYLRCPVKAKDSLISIQTIVDLWEGDKDGFIKSIKKRIEERIKTCNNLDNPYEIEGYPPKTACKPLLLLHNVQTVINQNKGLISKKEYGLPVFYKFPFHLYKKEKWDVEHIDSNTSNDLEKDKDQKEWLKYSLLDNRVMEEDKVVKRIRAFLKGGNQDSFEVLLEDIEKLLHESEWDNSETDKNKIWNFVLLDAGTNRGYGNAIFPAKRRSIIGKDQGKKIHIDDELKVIEENGEISFVPPVTKNVFLKYYNTSVDNLRSWNQTDAIAYKRNIFETLKEFGVTDNCNTNENDNK